MEFRFPRALTFFSNVFRPSNGIARALGLVGVTLGAAIFNHTVQAQSSIDHTKAEACGNPKVETQKLPVKIVAAFPSLEIGRPIVMCAAGDGTSRFYIASQYGVIYSIDPTDSEVSEGEVLFDFAQSVSYKDRENEEGFLGMAFHPKFKDNGQLFIFYTSSQNPRTSVISRFNRMKDNPKKIDPASEMKLLEVPQPAWNHNGGTIEFGPDGYLYIALGDGGGGNDMFKNGQKLSTLMGSILRIDVDNQDDGKNYSIPKDNPFIDTENARPEIWAYGLRNVWRFSFDPVSKNLWAADVGQDLWEEVNIIKRGGNYGWSEREAMHPFGRNGSGPSDQLVDPIWEYHHDIGKSITGGVVYRGKAIPELVGVYLFADYVAGKMWGIKYDEKEEKVVAHYEFPLENNVPVITFGTDADGEVYFSDPSGHIFKFEPTK